MVEGAGEAVVEGAQHGFEEGEFFGGWIERLAHQDQAGLIEMFREGERVEDLKGPLWIERGTGDGPLLVREGCDENEAVGREDFAVDEFAPHFLAVGHAEAVEELAAGAEVHVAEADGAAFGSPPAAKVIGVGPSGEDEFAGGVEHAGDGEAVVRARVRGIGSWVGGGHGVFITGVGWLCPEVLMFKRAQHYRGTWVSVGIAACRVESKSPPSDIEGGAPDRAHKIGGSFGSNEADPRPVRDGWHPSSRNEESGERRGHKTEGADLFL